MSQKLAGKVAVVTGASKGIGASIALHLAAEGAAVVVNYSSSKEGADRVVGEIVGKGGKAVAVQANVAKQADIRRLFSDTKKAFGTARHSHQQRRRLRVRPARERDPRALPQDVRPQRAGPDTRVAGSGQVFRTRRRQHRQHQLGGRHPGPAERRRCTARPRPRSTQ